MPGRRVPGRLKLEPYRPEFQSAGPLSEGLHAPIWETEEEE
jgi:hypothetical protein